MSAHASASAAVNLFKVVLFLLVVPLSSRVIGGGVLALKA